MRLKIAAVITLGILGSWITGTLIASSTQTTTWGIHGNRSARDRQLDRLRPGEVSARRLVIAIDSNAPGSTTTDANVFGILDRVSYYADGNAPSYDVNITDADGVIIFADAAGKSSNDPCGFAVTQANTAGTRFAGVPFAGALTVRWGNLDDGPGCTTENLHIILYFREVWQ